MVSIGQTDEDFIRSAKKKRIPYTDMLFNLVSNNENSGIGGAFSEANIGVVRILDYPKTPEDYGTLAHEIFHCADMILRDVGVSLDNSSQETYAYLIGYITSKIYECI